MTNAHTVPLTSWLKVIDDEYLAGFIKAGGSAVKFAVAEENQRPALQQALKARCEAGGYLFVFLDAGDIRAHMPQDLFFSLARKIDWRAISRRVILQLLAENGFKTNGIDPIRPANVIDSIVVANGCRKDYAVHALRPALADNIFANPDLVKAFRDAMDHLCWIEATEPAESENYRGQAILNWLRGDVLAIGPLKEFHIRTRIDRTTARYFMESASHWIRRAGYSGMVIILDNSRVAITKNPRDGRKYYTKMMAMDHYEMLREFIDDVDRLSGVLLTVLTGYEFLDPDPKARGWGIYDALRTRVMDDVRDRDIANPVSVLVRVSSTGAQ